jgi:chromosome segregation ATPase
MSNLQSDLDTVKAGIAKLLHFSLNAPKQFDVSRQSYDDYHKQMSEHTEAANKWAQEEGPKVVEAGFNVLAQFFKDISSIADGVNK